MSLERGTFSLSESKDPCVACGGPSEIKIDSNEYCLVDACIELGVTEQIVRDEIAELRSGIETEGLGPTTDYFHGPTD